MDLGNYTNAEAAYRKAVECDSTFLIGWSLLGRISSNQQERKYIRDLIKSQLGDDLGDEQLLLDVYTALLQLTIMREEVDSIALKKIYTSTFDLAEKNLKLIAHRYPDEVYNVSEYIEVVHYVHGAEKALQLIYELDSIRQHNPFILGYSSILEAERGNFAMAYKKASFLEKLVPAHVPKSWVVWAHYFLYKNEFQNALFLARRALYLDSGNIDAQRLEIRLKKLLGL